MVNDTLKISTEDEVKGKQLKLICLVTKCTASPGKKKNLNNNK